jgi:hypothetical protein
MKFNKGAGKKKVGVKKERNEILKIRRNHYSNYTA